MASKSVFQNIQPVAKDKLTFTLSKTDVAFANTLRRLIMTGVRTVAFRADMTEDGRTTDVVIVKNSTPMTNEMLADRIGLLPVTVKDPASWNSKNYKFVLKVTNDSTLPRDVFASDIEVFKLDENGKETKVPNTTFFVPDRVTQETALLAVLKGKRPGQDPETIELTARATVGTGREHARFIPTSQCAYKYTINPDERVQNEKFETWAINNKKIADKEELKDSSIRSKLRKEYDTLELERCYLEENGVPYSFDFQVESIGTMPVHHIVKAGLDAGIRLCMPFTNLNLMPTTKEDEAQRKARDANFPRILPAANRLTGYDFIFQRQDHTLGNLLQSYMELYMMDTPGSLLTYVGYYIPHPLRDEMVLRVGVASNDQKDARAIVSEAAQGCMNLFRSWSDQWARATGIAQTVESEPSEEESNEATESTPETSTEPSSNEASTESSSNAASTESSSSPPATKPKKSTKARK